MRVGTVRGVRTLASLQREPDGESYPRDALQGLTTALVGFSAAFLGRQDCAWVAKAGLTATCVDTDQERLDEMAPLYPDGWEFVCADVYDYGDQHYVLGHEYDLVSLDPPTDLFDECAAALPLWCGLARRLVVLGTGERTTVNVPKGWKITDFRWRSHFRGGVYWTVLEPTP